MIYLRNGAIGKQTPRLHTDTSQFLTTSKRCTKPNTTAISKHVATDSCLLTEIVPGKQTCTWIANPITTAVGNARYVFTE